MYQIETKSIKMRFFETDENLEEELTGRSIFFNFPVKRRPAYTQGLRRHGNITICTIQGFYHRIFFYFIKFATRQRR